MKKHLAIVSGRANQSSGKMSILFCRRCKDSRGSQPMLSGKSRQPRHHNRGVATQRRLSKMQANARGCSADALPQLHFHNTFGYRRYRYYITWLIDVVLRRIVRYVYIFRGCDCLSPRSSRWQAHGTFWGFPMKRQSPTSAPEHAHFDSSEVGKSRLDNDGTTSLRPTAPPYAANVRRSGWPRHP